MHITEIKSLWHEPANFELERADTGAEYIFLHYLTSVTIILNGESGTHEELPAMDGEYSRMWHEQARWYEDSIFCAPQQ